MYIYIYVYVTGKHECAISLSNNIFIDNMCILERRLSNSPSSNPNLQTPGCICQVVFGILTLLFHAGRSDSGCTTLLNQSQKTIDVIYIYIYYIHIYIYMYVCICICICNTVYILSIYMFSNAWCINAY